MPRSCLQACLIFTLVLSTGCGLMTQNRQQDDGVTYAIGDMPAEKHAPRSLESLTKNPRSHSGESTPGSVGDINPSAGPEGQLDLNQVGLAKRDQVHVESPSPQDSIEELPQDQLPTILENAEHPFSHISPDQLPKQSAVGEPGPVTVPSSDVGESQLGAEQATTNSATVNAAASHPTKKVGQPFQGRTPAMPVMSEQPSDELPDSSNIKFVVKPAADPVKRIPVGLDALFAQAKQSEANGSINSNSDPLLMQARGTDPQLPQQADSGQATAVKTVAYLQEVAADDTDTATGTTKGANDDTSDSAPSQVPQANPVDAGASLTESNRLKQLTWNDQIDQAVHLLRDELETSDVSPPTSQQIALHLLQTINGTSQGEELNIPDISESEKAFWQHQISALRYLLHKESIDDPTTEAATKLRQTSRAAEQLRLAVNQLANIASLQIGQCVFCNQVMGFGQITPAKTVFVSGQQVLIYCEIENYALQKTNASAQSGAEASHEPSQLVAEIRGEYSIISADNRVVFQHQYPVVQDRAQRRRQDFYMYFPVTIPNLPAGEYRLQLSIEDLVGNKVASPREPLKFRVVNRPGSTRTQGKTAREPRDRRLSRSP